MKKVSAFSRMKSLGGANVVEISHRQNSVEDATSQFQIVDAMEGIVHKPLGDGFTDPKEVVSDGSLQGDILAPVKDGNLLQRWLYVTALDSCDYDKLYEPKNPAKRNKKDVQAEFDFKGEGVDVRDLSLHGAMCFSVAVLKKMPNMIVPGTLLGDTCHYVKNMSFSEGVAFMTNIKGHDYDLVVPEEGLPNQFTSCTEHFKYTGDGVDLSVHPTNLNIQELMGEARKLAGDGMITDYEPARNLSIKEFLDDPSKVIVDTQLQHELVRDASYDGPEV